MGCYIFHEPIHKDGKRLWTIFDLQSDNTFVVGRRVHHNIGKVSIQRDPNCVQFLCLCNYNRIIGVCWNMVSQNKHWMPSISKSRDNSIQHAVIREEA